ncbi:MAG: helix-turn-helix domain-containing protein [Bacteroides sp.]|nr:helix-turn-helix domain-containing protein [Bacteroides sp.]MCM1549304.1 helix-turn-helix domain-containing protein [Clostridium sp.]
MERVNQRTNCLLGKNLKRIRISQGLRNKDVVAQLQLRGLNISTAILSKVETGLNNPSVNMLIALTEIYHCDFNAFFEQNE